MKERVHSDHLPMHRLVILSKPDWQLQTNAPFVLMQSGSTGGQIVAFTAHSSTSTIKGVQCDGKAMVNETR